jgi:hypothetical protein
MDLRRYNVLVLPAGGEVVLKEKLEALTAWTKAGGTLVAIGSSAGALAKEKDGLGNVRLLPDVLDKMDDYRQAVVREWEGRKATPDPERVWAFGPPEEVEYPWLVGQADEDLDEDELKRRDSWRSIFMPQGAILAGRVDDRSWLTAGCGEYVPVVFSGDTVLVSPPDVQAPVRLGVFEEAASTARQSTKTTGARSAAPSAKASEEEEDGASPTFAPPGHAMRLRMSGLLWPEAAERLANTAYVTRESVGSGQVILFASNPTFRAAALGTTRLFANAIVYGPGLGASHPIRP